MNFCANCENMLYIKLQSETNDGLTQYCRNCANVEPLNSNNLCVSKTNFRRSNLTYSTAVNKYTKLDPTLPRSNTIKCPNETCDCNTDSAVPREVIYIRYDDTNVKYMYMCSHCDTVWKNDETK